MGLVIKAHVLKKNKKHQKLIDHSENLERKRIMTKTQIYRLYQKTIKEVKI